MEDVCGAFVGRGAAILRAWRREQQLPEAALSPEAIAGSMLEAAFMETVARLGTPKK